VQDLQCFFWDEEEVNRNLKRIMMRSFKEAWDFNQEQRVSLRLAAYTLSVDRVAGAMHARGIFP
jgi:glutamate dehydrogenase/leucine dehydrogenase